MTKTIVKTFRISKELLEKVEAKAKAESRTLSNFIIFLLEKYLKK